jgi:excisionase family DNA binding protein
MPEGTGMVELPFSRNEMNLEAQPRNLPGQGPSDVHLLTVDEVALILRVPKSWVYAHLGDLPTIRLGRYVRFRASDIEEFLANKGSCQ